MTICAIREKVRAASRKPLLFVLPFILAAGPSRLDAAAAPEISIAAEPLRYSFVEGDSEKFRMHQWVKDRYVGGIREFSLGENNAVDGISLETEGRALIDENDLKGELSLKKKGAGFFHLDYAEFSRFYDGTGGFYYPFTALAANELDKDLELEIGRLSLEVGLTFENFPEIVFFYEREFRDGAKSRLTWTAVKEGAVTRSIGPSWQEIDEIVDIFGVRARREIRGVELKGEQRWEIVRSEMTREERFLATTGVAADKKIRVQNQDPRTTMMTTTLEAERWSQSEKVFTGAAYRFYHLNNQEVENIFEMDENRNPTNFANPKQIRGARADNDYDAHTWVGTLMVLPWPSVGIITKLKSEVIRRESNSTYPSDTTPAAPDGIINNIEQSANDGKLLRWGEAVTLRFTGIPRTALYGELELEQVRNWLSEDRQSLAGQSASNANEVFSRETLTPILKEVWTLGTQTSPWPFLNVTTHLRQRRTRNDYDDTRETDPGANTARSAFIDEQRILTSELATRITLIPCPRVRPSFRYQLRADDYATRAENEAAVETDMTSHIYTVDLALQALNDLWVTASFSRQNAWVASPAGSAVSPANTPRFNAGVSTWLFSADYLLRPELSFNSTAQYSRARNFNDFTGSGLPLGAAFDEVDVTAGLKWSVQKDVAIEPKYGFYHYQPNSGSEFGRYTAHVIWLELSLGWG